MSKHPPRGARADFVEFYRIQTRWMDNDAYGHMNNAVHYALFDTAVNGWLSERGLLDPRTSLTIGLVVESGCRYHQELSFPGWIEAGMRVSHLGRSSIRYEIGLFPEGADVTAADGHFVHVYVDRETRRPTPIEAGRREKLEALRG